MTQSVSFGELLDHADLFGFEATLIGVPLSQRAWQLPHQDMRLAEPTHPTPLSVDDPTAKLHKSLKGFLLLR